MSQTGWLSRNVSSHSLEARSPRPSAAGLVSGDSSLLGLQVCLLAVRSHGLFSVLTCVEREGHLSGVSFYKDSSGPRAHAYASI